uniref:SRR1 domain-containing protein n=2 Tax=Macrostomum lignano TaxID=282301 RepID=A0A1I8H8Z5_9PLAT
LQTSRRSSSDGWQQQPCRSQTRRRRHRKKPGADEATNLYQRVKMRFEEEQQLLSNSPLPAKLSKELQKIFASLQLSGASIKFASSICLGLGSPTDSRDARLQLALWMSALKDEASEAGDSDKDVLAASAPLLLAVDPAFTPEDEQLLSSLGVTVGDPTSAASRYSALPLPCLAFLPHAPNFVINNFLYENWSKSRLHGHVLLGNSLASLRTNLSAPVLRQLGYIESAAEVCVEAVSSSSLANRADEFFTAFNDISLQWFPKIEKGFIGEVESSLGEPVYDCADDRLKDLLGF